MLSILLAVPSFIYSVWHGVIPTSFLYFIIAWDPGINVKSFCVHVGTLENILDKRQVYW